MCTTFMYTHMYYLDTYITYIYTHIYIYTSYNTNLVVRWFFTWLLLDNKPLYHGYLTRPKIQPIPTITMDSNLCILQYIRIYIYITHTHTHFVSSYPCLNASWTQTSRTPSPHRIHHFSNAQPMATLWWSCVASTWPMRLPLSWRPRAAASCVETGCGESSF